VRVVRLEQNKATVDPDTNELLALSNALLVVLGHGPKAYGIPRRYATRSTRWSSASNGMTKNQTDALPHCA